MMMMMKHFILFYTLYSHCRLGVSNSVSAGIEEILNKNPLLAKMPMFETANSTFSENLEFIAEKSSTKRSPELVDDVIHREVVTDNFDANYKKVNSTFFDKADRETQDIPYRNYSNSKTPLPTGRSLFDEAEKTTNEKTTQRVSSTTSMPFIASQSLFDTTISSPIPINSRDSDWFAKTSPYFKSFPPTTTATSSIASLIPMTSQIISDETIEDEEVEKFFVGNENPEEEEEEEEEEEDEEDDSEDISKTTETVRNMENQEFGATMGIPKAKFQGSSYMKLQPLTNEEMAIISKREKDDSKQNYNEAVQYNGRYSVSATKYYVDNRIDGEHYLTRNDLNEFDPAQDQQMTNDPFAIEKEVQKTSRMYGSQTLAVDPLGLELEVNESRKFDEPRSNVYHQMKNGKNVETRETIYNGQKTVVELWNKLLHGHDLIQFPGAIFDNKFDEHRRKSGSYKGFPSKMLISNNPKRSKSSRKIMASGVPNFSRDQLETLKQLTARTDIATRNIESACFDSKKNSAIRSLLPFKTEENVSKLECLLKCAVSRRCHGVTYSKFMKTCYLYSQNLSEQLLIPSRDYSYHRKISEKSLKCVKTFVSTDFNLPNDPETESSSYLRLVEKDKSAYSQTRTIFPMISNCALGDDLIFVRSDNAEGSQHKSTRFLEISEDDCVFACLTNTRPGGGKPLSCVATEYDKSRGLCYLLTTFPGDTMMTPKPINPVSLYEKICVQQASANKCSGGQPIRFRQKVLIGHLVDARSVSSASECIDVCIAKSSIGCVSLMFYSDEKKFNCILNDSTHKNDPKSFHNESTTIVDYFSIDDCLGIPEIQQRIQRKRTTKANYRIF